MVRLRARLCVSAAIKLEDYRVYTGPCPIQNKPTPKQAGYLELTIF